MKQGKTGDNLRKRRRNDASRMYRRYLQRRRADPDVRNLGRGIGCVVQVKDCWDEGNPIDRARNRQDFTDAKDIHCHHLGTFAKSILAKPAIQIAHERATRTSPKTPGAGIESAFPGSRPSDPIETRLAAYFEELAQLPHTEASLRSQINKSIGSRENIDVVMRAMDGRGGDGFAIRVCLFAPFWLRRPQDWRGHDAVDLLRFLLVRYDVPDWLYREWFHGEYIQELKWLCWFIIFAQGGSLRRAAPLFDWRIPAKFSSCLFNVSAELSPVEACAMAEVKRLGGSEIDFPRLSPFHGYCCPESLLIDPTEPPYSKNYARFWRETVRWMIKHRETLPALEWPEILDWANHERSEAERTAGHPFSWKAISVRKAIEKSGEYLRRRSYRGRRQYWRRYGWDWVWEDPAGGRWSFVELTSSDELFEDGIALHHCVATYSRHCLAGKSAVVSLRYNDVRQLTIEVAPSDRRLVQLRGVGNRPPTDEEQRVVSLWMENTVQPSA